MFARVLLIVTLCAALPALAMPPIQTWQTTSGAHVYFVETHDLPMLDISIDFPAGSAFDTRAKSGVAGLTQLMLHLGATGLSEDEISRKIADVGAQLDGDFDLDRGGLSLRTLTSSDELTQALDVFTRVLQTPEFPAAALEREKIRLVADIKEADTKPDSIVDRNFSQLVYGDHPYALRASGEVDSVPTVTRDDLIAFYRVHYTADQATVAIIGDLDHQRAEAIAEQLTAQLPHAAAPATIPPVPPLAHAELKVIPHPATQGHVLIGAPGMKRGDADYFPLYVGNYVLGGGGFVSRILNEVREKRGLAYTAYSYFMPMQQNGPFMIGLQTRKDQTAEALAVARATLKKFVDEGPTADELKQAKENIVGGFPLRLDSNRKILDYLSVIGFYHLPLTYIDDFPANVEKVTLADVRDAFKRRVDPERMVTVVVGPEPAEINNADNAQ
jgi:zinc protease